MIGFKVQGDTYKAATVGRGNSITNCKLQIANCKLPAPKHLPPTTYHLPSSFYSLRPRRRGLSLLEVLISIFVLAIGLLGVAAIIPLGQISLWETAKADRAGACGRAALRNAEVHNLLDYRHWYWQNGQWGINPDGTPIADNYASVSTSYDALPFVIDPLGYAKLSTPLSAPYFFGQTSATNFLPRRTLRTLPFAGTTINADVFFWSDDLPFDVPKDATSRPSLITVTDPTTGIVSIVSEGSYSCFYTVMPAATEVSMPIGQRRHFTVSVVVCYKRNFQIYDPTSPISSVVTHTLDGEHTAHISNNTAPLPGFPGMGLGGGTVQLDAGNSVNVKANQWVMLYNLGQYNPSTNQWVVLPRCHWYRVVGVGGSTNTLSLVGPDWDPNLDATLVVVPGVIGVYTCPMELDNDLLW